LLNWYETVILVISAVSALSALAAVLITWRGLELSNSVVLSLEDCQASFPMSVYENDGQQFAEFRVVLRNHGLPLYSMRTLLVLLELASFGRVSVGLERRNEASEHDVFSKGMVAELSIKSYELDETTCSLLAKAGTAKKHRPRLRVESQGYLVQELPLWGLFDSVKIRWNELAFRLNSLFERQVGQNERGVPMVKSHEILPTFTIASFQLECFLRYVREHCTAAEGAGEIERSKGRRNRG